MKNFPLLGGLSPAQFLRDYWHKKPLLIRQAIPGFTPLLSREELFGLSAKDEVESRLVTHFDDRWQLDTGPFDKLPSVRKKDWTLLVQGVNLHDDAADALLRRFRFIPDTRLDDLMISYATDTGGVGPHFDSYDVFLLQAQGQRRWRIGAQKDLALAEGMPLKILRDFRPDEEFVLDPGDMLYLPPHYAHDGIAVGECMTYSIGFRAPSYQELGQAFLEFMADSIDLPGRYADPDLKAAKHPAKIEDGFLTTIAGELQKVKMDRDDMTIFLGEYLSEPKPGVRFDAPDSPRTLAQFRKAALRHGVKLDRRTRMQYRGRHVFINGESVVAGRSDARLLAMLADERLLAPSDIAGLSPDALATLHAWYSDGWVSLSGS